MAALRIRDLDDAVKDKLRRRAARHGRSMEAEVRAILTSAVSGDAADNDLFGALSDRFGGLGGVDLGISARTPTSRAATEPFC